MNNQIRLNAFALAALLGAAALTLPFTAAAQPAGVVRAAVFPCDPAGSLLPEYDSSDDPCSGSYSVQYASLRQNLHKEDLSIEIERLRKENDALRRQLKAQKRSLKFCAL